MGMGASRPKGKDKNIISLDEFKDKDIKEITEVKDITFSQGDFVLEKNSRFRDSYEIGVPLGLGSYGEVRKGVNKITKATRAVKIIK